MLLNKAIIDGEILNVIILEVDDEIAKALIIEPENKIVGISDLDVCELDSLERVRELTSNEERIMQNILQAKELLDNSFKEIFDSIVKDTDRTPLTYNDLMPLLNEVGYKNLYKLVSANIIITSKTIRINILDDKLELDKDYASHFATILNAPELTIEGFVSLFINLYNLKKTDIPQDDEEECDSCDENIEDLLTVLGALAGLINK